MARKSQRFRRERRMTRLQQKLVDTGQLKAQEDNSVMVQKMKEMGESEEPISTKEITPEKTEEMADTIETMIEQLVEAKEEKPMPKEVASPMNLTKLKKAELLKMAKAMKCEVTAKNTKAQIIEAIEKQST